MLVKAYGEYWNPDLVDWGKRGPGNRGSLRGIARPQGALKRDSYQVDMWSASAIYALFLDYNPIYVGQAVGRLGPRLRDHQNDRHVGRWNQFSFYSLSKANKSGTASNPGARHLGPGIVLDTMESVAIRIFDPPLNRKHEQIPGAARVSQDVDRARRTTQEYLETILREVRQLE